MYKSDRRYGRLSLSFFFASSKEDRANFDFYNTYDHQRSTTSTGSQAYQLIPKAIMGFQFTSANERLALEGLDDDLYPILGIHDHSRAHTRKIKKWPRNVCSGDIHASRPLYGKLPQMLPLTLDYLRQFRQSLDSKEDLLWSVIWYSDTRWSGDIIRPDNFRTVMTFSQSCIQFALQPVQVDAGTPRL